MYDFTHCLSDSLEGITHSICTLEFEINRQLYDWVLDELKVYHPQQIEFARLNLTYTVLSKRKLIELVEKGHVTGWDDPRMPTISGLRRRGYTPASIRNFCERIGVAKRDSMVDVALLEFSVREDLNKNAPRVMGVLRPLKVVIDNYPEDKVEELEAENNPEDSSAGKRKVPDEKTGEVIEVHCTYDPKTRGGWSEDGRKVRGTLHWVSAGHALKAEVRLYEHLFIKENPSETKDSSDFKTYLNPNSQEKTGLFLCRFKRFFKQCTCI